jgi:Ca2+-binding RTX toxin-like protein
MNFPQRIWSEAPDTFMISSTRPRRDYPLDFIETLRNWANSSRAEKDLETVFGQALHWPSAYRHIQALQGGDFSLLPDVKTLPASAMPGLWGGYSRETREIYISVDCPEDLNTAVLLEEIGHFFDQEFCSVETPGEEGARFTAIVLGLPLDAASCDDSLAPIFLEGRQLLVEAARKLRGSSKRTSSRIKSGGKKRGSSGGFGGGGNGGAGYAEVGSGSSNPKLMGNIIYATGESVRIPQKAAGDRLIGSRGNDTFVALSQDVVIEDPNGGTDTVESSITFSLAKHSIIEKLVLTGGANIHGTGNLKANVISGNSGNNKLDGGTDSAIDTLIGGAGNDTYTLRDNLDVVVEAVGGGTDTIETTQPTFSMANYANIENLAYSGTGAGVTFTGNSGNNYITGTSGADSLDGGEGVDILNGGKGDDFYNVNNSFDIILDDSGIDTVYTSANSYTLGGGLENLFNAKDSDATLVGNSDGNSIKGGAGNDSLYGADGNDTLLTSSESDSDILNGGKGDDFFVLSSDKNVTILDEEGIDTVLASVSHTLSAGVENLTFVQSNTDKYPLYDPNSDISSSRGGDNTRIYPNGRSLLSDFGSANDVDIIAIKLSKGSTYEFKISGDKSEDGFYDLGVNMQLLDGSGRVLDSAWDYYFDDYATIKFTAGITADYYLRVDPFYFYSRYNSGKYEITAITTEFADALDGTGNSENNKITGNAGNNLLIGESGNDTLDGGTSDRETFDGGSGGLDTFNGGSGDDYFLNWNEQDRVVEAASADRTKNIDTIVSSKLDFSLAIYLGRNDLLNVENFIWEGEETIQLIGNFLNNSLTSQQNTNDTLSGGAGNDFISSGGGDDLLDAEFSGWFYFNRSFLYVDITNSEASSGMDTLSGGDGSDTYIIDNPGDRIIETFGPGLDEVRAVVSYTLPDESLGYVEDLVAISASANSLTGNSLDNRIEAFDGTDSTLDGGAGSDVLVGKSGNDSLSGGAGSDLLQGALGDDTLNAGNDSLNADYMQGGLGNDLYILNDSPAFIEEGLNEGIDEVQVASDYTLDPNLENLTIVGSDSVQGTGNELDNLISGNTVANTLSGLAGADILLGNAGNDYLDGGVGADSINGGEGNDTLTGGTISGLDDGYKDTLRGGIGNDLFLIYSRQDDFDGEFGDKDTVYTPVTNFDTRNLVENLYLGSGAFNSTINGGFGGFQDTAHLKGFGDSENNIIVGNNGDNVLEGAGGNDTLVGGAGNDTLIVDSNLDLVFDTLGTNWIYYFESSLSEYVSSLTLSGNGRYSGQATLIGNPPPGDANPNTIIGRLISDTLLGMDGNDTIFGMGGNDSIDGGNNDDILDGGEGFDTLVGGEGKDFFVSGGGEDTFIGGNGNDTYQINASSPDKIIETSLPSLSGGIDTILTNGNFSIAPITSGLVSSVDQNPYIYIENLVYDEVFAGNTGLGVSLTGNAWGNSIQGGSNGDTLDGGVSFIIDAGDTLNGGLGSDFYIIDSRYDWIIDNSLSGDTDTVFTYVNFDPIASSDPTNVTRAKSFASWDTLSFAYLDNFVFMDVASAPIRGVGNALGNSITGNAENNVILGLDGDDTIIGNAGNDNLYGDRDASSLSGSSTLPGYSPGVYPSNPGDYDITALGANASLFAGNDDGNDYLDGGEGNDLLSGNDGKDSLLGGEGNDILFGGAGIDSMIGGIGSDSFYVDEVKDVMVENQDEGTDWVFSTQDIYQLQDNIENIVIYGPNVHVAVGNRNDNFIYVGQSTLHNAPVTLSGGDGNDVLQGFFGTVIQGYSGDLSRATTGDYLDGGSGNDMVNGGGGIDTLEGGLGNDTIVVDCTFDTPSMLAGGYDRIWEFGYEGDPSNGGNDWVMTNAVIIDLKDPSTDPNFNGPLTVELDYVENGMFIENLLGTDIGGQLLAGNWLNNTIVGNNGSDMIFGEDGNDFLANNGSTVTSIDTLTGGGGNDIFSLRNYNNGVTALYADEVFNLNSLSLTAWDTSFAYITDFSGGDSLLLPTILPDLNGGDPPPIGFVTRDIFDPIEFTQGNLVQTRGIYIQDLSGKDIFGNPVYTYNLIAVGQGL